MEKQTLLCMFSFVLLSLLMTACQPSEPELPKPGSGFIPGQARVPVQFSAASSIPNRFIVSFKNPNCPAGQRLAGTRSAGETASEILRTHGLQEQVPERIFSMEGFQGMLIQLSEAEAAELENDTAVSLVEPDQVFTLAIFPAIRPPLTPTGEAFGMSVQTIPPNIERVGGSKPPNSFSRRAWILDSGVDMDHPDLNVDSLLSTGFCTSSGGGSSPEDVLGHGTHVAGIIGAKNNTIGVCGVAAGVPLISVKVIGDNGKGRLSDVIAGLAYTAGLATHKDVVHLSLGSLASIILDSAVIACRNQSGATIVVAAGNESANVAAYSPARIIHTGILVVAAVDPADQFSSFSNFGANRIAYAAPGEMILSTFTDGKYAVMSGTSLAAPHVSGILLSSFKATGSGVALNPPDGALYRIIHR